MTPVLSFRAKTVLEISANKDATELVIQDLRKEVSTFHPTPITKTGSPL